MYHDTLSTTVLQGPLFTHLLPRLTNTLTRDEKDLLIAILDHRRTHPRDPLSIHKLALDSGWSEPSVYRKLKSLRDKLSDQGDDILNRSTPIDRDDPFIQALYESLFTKVQVTKRLTERELEVFNLLTDKNFSDLSLKQQADQLSISPRTLSKHLENIYRKLGVNTRASATIIAMEAKRDGEF